MPVSNAVDLEILLGWVPEAEGFRLTVLYNAPGDRDDDRYFGQQPVRFDLERLDEVGDDADVDAYGRLLGEMVFVDSTRATLARALDASRYTPMNLRIAVDVHAPLRYHEIRWETLCSPDSGQRLTTSENIRFSRYLPTGRGMQPTVLARTDTMTALVAVANPTGIEQIVAGGVELAPIDVEQELNRAKAALGGMSLRVLPENGRRATRSAVLEELSKGVHVLYLVCHGRIRHGRSQLVLETGDGDPDLIDGTAFANDVGSLRQIPTMVVLCSCESAGAGRAARPAAENAAGHAGEPADEPRMAATARSLAAVGPALASAGATVVIGMQGSVTMTTAGLFLPQFFAALQDDGVPAHAMATARRCVRGRPDWFMPVLYSRLRRGSAWYEERFGGDKQRLFANLRTRIGNDKCTPVVGSGIVGEDGVLPSRQALARHWVAARQLPIAEFSADDLATVAQFVRVEEDGGADLVRDELQGLVRAELRRLHARTLPHADFGKTPLPTLVSEIARCRRQEADGADGYSRLVRLNRSIYVTTSWTSLLEDALEDAQRTPEVRHFDWRKSTADYPWPYEPGFESESPEEREKRETAVGARDRGGEQFTTERPLVYHLAGTMEHEQTLVITEDDHFTWMQEWMKQLNSIPAYLKIPLIKNSLLFLGYHFDDWEFRMMFEAVKSLQPRRRNTDSGPHVGVQFEPGTLRIDKEAAKTYLESYFGVDNVTPYWQTSNRFLTELQGVTEP